MHSLYDRIPGSYVAPAAASSAALAPPATQASAMPPTAAAVALSPQTLQSIVKAAVSKALKARAAEENEEGAQETAASPAHVTGTLTDADVC